VDGSSNDRVYLYKPSPKGGLVKRLLLLALILLLGSCHHLTEPPLGQLELVVDGRRLDVRPELWRNFFPYATPPDGDPLVVYVRIEAPDSAALPPGLAATASWVVRGGDIWETRLVSDPTWMPAYAAGFYAKGGPKWDPGLTADVTLRFTRPGGETWDVLIPGCVIQMVW
jgi:hypothetical protein